ncbi:MAG: ATP-binding cassette domain-containing protein [Bifidobacteriaceae bacterium]|jgi:ABC-2 type transport system ATP-binding protein|nr:ATP-binding cassette domain-containing protein [Bifidobacteriaceae bacterium]
MTVEAHGLGYHYGHKQALKGFDASFGPGVNAVLGPNGAGKTTLLSILAGLKRPHEGAVSFDGSSLRSDSDWSRYRSCLGFLPQEATWTADMTVGSFLAYFAAMRGVGRSERSDAVVGVLEQVGLHAESNRRLGSLSGGQRRRVFLAQAMIHGPSVLVLDEPTAGLDPAARVRFRELVVEVAKQRVVVIATHLLEDAVHLGAHTVVLNEGAVIWQGDTQALGQVLGPKEPGVKSLGSPEELGFLALMENADPPE